MGLARFVVVVVPGVQPRRKLVRVAAYDAKLRLRYLLQLEFSQGGDGRAHLWALATERLAERGARIETQASTVDDFARDCEGQTGHPHRSSPQVTRPRVVPSGSDTWRAEDQREG